MVEILLVQNTNQRDGHWKPTFSSHFEGNNQQPTGATSVKSCIEISNAQINSIRKKIICDLRSTEMLHSVDCG